MLRLGSPRCSLEFARLMFALGLGLGSGCSESGSEATGAGETSTSSSGSPSDGTMPETTTAADGTTTDGSEGGTSTSEGTDTETTGGSSSGERFGVLLSDAPHWFLFEDGELVQQTTLPRGQRHTRTEPLGTWAFHGSSTGVDVGTVEFASLLQPDTGATLLATDVVGMSRAFLPRFSGFSPVVPPVESRVFFRRVAAQGYEVVAATLALEGKPQLEPLAALSSIPEFHAASLDMTQLVVEVDEQWWLIDAVEGGATLLLPGLPCAGGSVMAVRTDGVAYGCYGQPNEGYPQVGFIPGAGSEPEDVVVYVQDDGSLFESFIFADGDVLVGNRHAEDMPHTTIIAPGGVRVEVDPDGTLANFALADSHDLISASRFSRTLVFALDGSDTRWEFTDFAQHAWVPNGRRLAGVRTPFYAEADVLAPRVGIVDLDVADPEISWLTPADAYEEGSDIHVVQPSPDGSTLFVAEDRVGPSSVMSFVSTSAEAPPTFVEANLTTTASSVSWDPHGHGVVFESDLALYYARTDGSLVQVATGLEESSGTSYWLVPL